MNLQEKANNLRKDILTMVYAAQSGHPGGSLSVIDILTTIYFGEGKNGKFLNYDSKNPQLENRDYCIVSKGHASPAVYATLAEAGFFNKDEFFSFRQVNSKLQGHPTKKVPGIEVSGGSLGQGLSVANGIAMGKPEQKVYCILGDGELQEGQVWEAAMSSAHYKLKNLVAFVDRNTLQIDGRTEDVMSVGDVRKKFKSFGWDTLEINGHNFEEITEALNTALKSSENPTAIIAHTKKGHGISFMEDQAGWHGKAPNDEQLERALAQNPETLGDY